MMRVGVRGEERGEACWMDEWEVGTIGVVFAQAIGIVTNGTRMA